jgi:hypothetical protein
MRIEHDEEAVQIELVVELVASGLHRLAPHVMALLVNASKKVLPIYGLPTSDTPSSMNWSATCATGSRTRWGSA